MFRAEFDSMRLKHHETTGSSRDVGLGRMGSNLATTKNQGQHSSSSRNARHQHIEPCRLSSFFCLFLQLQCVGRGVFRGGRSWVRPPPLDFQNLKRKSTVIENEKRGRRKKNFHLNHRIVFLCVFPKLLILGGGPPKKFRTSRENGTARFLFR